MSPDLLAGSVGDPQSLNRYAYVLNDPCNLVDPLGLEQCTLRISVSYSAGFLPSSLQKRVLTTLEAIFANAGVNVAFVNTAPDVSVMIGVPIPQSGASGSNAANVWNPNIPLSHSSVDFGKLLVEGGGSRTTGLADAIARVAAHELGHSLFLPHNSLPRSIMSGPQDPFSESSFSDAEGINLQGRCEFLRRQGRGGAGGRVGAGYGFWLFRAIYGLTTKPESGGWGFSYSWTIGVIGWQPVWVGPRRR